MNFEDDYLLAREYASGLFDPQDDRFWVAVGAYVTAVETGLRGLQKTLDGDRITRIVFFFSKEARTFELSIPIFVSDRLGFLRQLRDITGIKEVGIYE